MCFWFNVQANTQRATNGNGTYGGFCFVYIMRHGLSFVQDERRTIKQ